MSNTGLREYIVTLHSYEHLDSFYEDMETPGGNLYIPDRAVDLIERRAISRNTHYLLTKEEAQLIRQDPRVLAVEIPARDNPTLVTGYSWTQTNTFSPRPLPVTTDKNWGLLYSTSESINSSLEQLSSVSATITRQLSGKNVDLVMPEAVIKKNHAEFARNSNGTGGYRTVETDWFAYGIGSSPFTYDYSLMPFHATHTAGTAGGNTQGWAKDCNIHFNIPNFGEGANYIGPWDYIRAWHNWKKVNAINPQTGVHNPTVVSLSTNTRSRLYTYQLGSIYYRGVLYPGPWNRDPARTDREHPSAWTNGTVTLLDVGFRVMRTDDNVFWYIFAGPTLAANDADITDAINDGVIIVQSAGNYSSRIDVPGGLDYNNYVIDSFTGDRYYQNRNEWNAPVIAVGNQRADRKLGYATDIGPAITIFAPGTNIISSFPDSDGSSLNPYSDPRGLNNDKLASISGTSMAAPQVAGVLASLAELWPTATQTQMRDFLLTHARNRMITEGAADNENPLYLRDSTDKTLYYPSVTFNVSPNKSSISSDELVVISVSGYLDSPFSWDTWSAKYNIPASEGIYIADQLYTNNNLLGNFGSPSTPFYGLFREPDTAGVAYWHSQWIANGRNIEAIKSSFALGIPSSDTTDYARIRTNSKTFLQTNNGSVFYDGVFDLPVGSKVYLTEEGNATAQDFIDGLTNIPVTITGPVTTVTRKVSPNRTTSRTSTLKLRTGGYSGTVQATASSISIVGVSPPPPEPPPVVSTYSFGAIPSSINEGSTGTFNVNTTNVSNGTTLYWTISHGTTVSADFSASSGSLVINGNTGSFTITPSADNTTEGNQTFTVQIRTGSTSGTVVATSSSVTVNDTSLTPTPATPTYGFSLVPTTISEGSSETFGVTTTNVSNGTTLYWTISHGTTVSADFSASSGSFSVTDNQGSFTVSPIADNTTEGSHAFTVQIRTGSTSGTVVATSSSVTVGDSSTTPPPATPVYQFPAEVPVSIDEGDSITYNFTTTNVPNGTTLYWTIAHTNTDAADFLETSGSFTVTNNAGSFTVRPKADETPG